MKTFAQALLDYRRELWANPWRGQLEQVDRCIRFLETEPNCFERSNAEGHFTGSALIVDEAVQKTLLVHHRKYDKWVQTGGHCDGVVDPFFTAWEEAYQESGLKDIRPLEPWKIADINIAEVLPYGGVPYHLHYDIRYVLVADCRHPLVVSHESNDVRWVDVARLRDYSSEDALIRLAERHFGSGATGTRWS